MTAITRYLGGWADQPQTYFARHGEALLKQLKESLTRADALAASKSATKRIEAITSQRPNDGLHAHRTCHGETRKAAAQSDAISSAPSAPATSRHPWATGDCDRHPAEWVCASCFDAAKFDAEEVA